MASLYTINNKSVLIEDTSPLLILKALEDFIPRNLIDTITNEIETLNSKKEAEFSRVNSDINSYENDIYEMTNNFSDIKDTIIEIEKQIYAKRTNKEIVLEKISNINKIIKQYV